MAAAAARLLNGPVADSDPRWRRAFALDATIVVVLGLVTSLPAHRFNAHGGWVWILQIAMVVPLLGRRRWPERVFALLCALAVVQFAVGVHLPSDLALLFALYTVAATGSRRVALVAAGVLEVGVIAASIRYAPTGSGVVGSLIFLTGLVLAAVFAGISVGTRRRYLAALLDRAATLERERDQQARLAATAERNRIAREMHDIVAHSLSVMTALADGAVSATEAAAGAATELAASTTEAVVPVAGAEVAEAMRQVSATGRKAMSEMRRVLGVLREDGSNSDGLAPQPGLGRLDALITQMRGAGLPVQLRVSGLPVQLAPTAETTVYRIVQESLTNVLKHAVDPTRVLVDLRWADGALVVDILNDGRATPAPGTDGHGIAGMRERSALYGGGVDAGPEPAGGWRVHATLRTDER